MAAVNRANRDGRTPLFAACGTRLFCAILLLPGLPNWELFPHFYREIPKSCHIPFDFFYTFFQIKNARRWRNDIFHPGDVWDPLPRCS